MIVTLLKYADSGVYPCLKLLRSSKYTRSLNSSNRNSATARIFLVSFFCFVGDSEGVGVDTTTAENEIRRGWLDGDGKYKGPMKRGRKLEHGKRRGSSIQSRNEPGVSLPYNLLKIRSGNAWW